MAYKLVTKILANRLKRIMLAFIALIQCGFIPGRHSSNNIIVAQEIIHKMRNTFGKKVIWLSSLIWRRLMIGSLDLEKAYDRIS